METIGREPDQRVRRSTSDSTNRKIDQQTLLNIYRYGSQSPEAISGRLRELEQEWDIERTLEVNAASVALASLALGTFVDKRWYGLTGIVAAFLLQHGLQGWCPPLPLFRALNVRTRHEIDEEKTALKALRGDFEQMAPASHPQEVLRAVRK